MKKLDGPNWTTPPRRLWVAPVQPLARRRRRWRTLLLSSDGIAVAGFVLVILLITAGIALLAWTR